MILGENVLYMLAMLLIFMLKLYEALTVLCLAFPLKYILGACPSFLRLRQHHCYQFLLEFPLQKLG